MLDFNLTSNELYSTAFRELGIHTFSDACTFIHQLPYGRNANRFDFLLVLSEGKGTCSSKHALLASLALENGIEHLELIVGIFLMSPETNPSLEGFFSDKSYKTIPEAHCYLNYKGERLDFTALDFDMEKIAPKIVREQRIDPNQVSDWKIMIHKHYLQGWLNRNPVIQMSLDEIWKDREEAIGLLSQ
ncbi:hypothetical protein [Fluviicola sp.]|uniref:hypothetical protein n=1 Tax=Fluviicola sp. TaxID=1917219 RepID=UPI003D282A5C